MRGKSCRPRLPLRASTAAPYRMSKSTVEASSNALPTVLQQPRAWATMQHVCNGKLGGRTPMGVIYPGALYRDGTLCPPKQRAHAGRFVLPVFGDVLPRGTIPSAVLLFIT